MPKKHSTHNKHTSHSTNHRTRNQQVVESFEFNEKLSVIPPSIAIGATITPLLNLSIRADTDDVVLLTATIGWKADADGSTVKFSIYRDPTNINNPAADGALIVSAIESAGANGFRISSFSWVDNPTSSSRQHSYVLTAQVINNTGSATVIGPLVLTATEIEE